MPEGHNGTADALHGRLLCHVNLAAGFRGGERQTQLLVQQLAARGYRQRLVARRGAPLAARCRGIDGLEICETASQPLLAARAARTADLLHAHEARAIYACWLAGGRRRPWLLTRRVDNPFKPSFLRDRAYRAAAMTAAVSRAIKAQIETAYPGVPCAVVADAHADLAAEMMDRHTTELLDRHEKPAATEMLDRHKMLDRHEKPAETEMLDEMLDRHTPSAALRERFRGKTVVGHIGALDHSHKGQGTLIEAARLAATSAPALHFVLVGDGRDEQRFRREAAGLDNLEFTGYVDNVGDWLAAFDLFAFPSLHEGLGSTLLDAMSFGLPVVATRVGGIPDIVEDGVNGRLIAPLAPDELLGALLQIIEDRELRERLSAGALAQAARYSPAAMADRYVALYTRMLAARH